MHLSAEAVGLAPALAVAYALVAHAEHPETRRAVAAAAGLMLIVAAFATELEPLALHTFLWAHLLQNVVLAEWAPGPGVFVPRPIYSFYEHAPRTWGPGPLGDQQLAGVTMAVEQAAVFFAVFAFYLSRFLKEEQADATVFDELRATRR